MTERIDKETKGQSESMRAGENRKQAGRVNRLVAVLLSGVLAVTSCLAVPQATEAEQTAEETLQNPRVEMGTCNTVYFGHYLQEDTNDDGTVDEKDEKQPIRWRVLWKNAEGTDAYVLADKVLDCQRYHKEEMAVTWETCSLRKWLNEDFLKNAFTEAEQAVILEQTLKNADNEEFGTPGGNDTVDKVYLPSFADMVNTAYGFSADRSEHDQARIGKATAYAKGQGVDTNKENSSGWGLRSPGRLTDSMVDVGKGGNLYTSGYMAYGIYNGVRPALHINLSSPLVKEGEKINTFMKKAQWDLVELGTYNGNPIRWRVLHTEGEDAFLLSDRVLEKRQYHEENVEGVGITWKDSSLRSWLNGKFYNEAFTEAEKAGIVKYRYDNNDNPWYGTKGGEATEDYVTLLSLEDIVNQGYGFITVYYCGHDARTAYGQDDSSSWWWLRSPGYSTNIAADVNSYGAARPDGDRVNNGNIGVRPVLHVNLSSLPLEKVETVSIDEGERVGDNSQTSEIPTQEPSTEKPDVTPGTPPEASTEEPAVPAGEKGNPTTVNIKNKKTYKKSKKVIIKDSDGIKKIKINSKTIKTKGKKRYSFKLSKYKKYLKKKGKWNKLVITDKTGKKTTIKFKIK